MSEIIGIIRKGMRERQIEEKEDLQASKTHTKEFRVREHTTACFNASINIISWKYIIVEREGESDRKAG